MIGGRFPYYEGDNKTIPIIDAWTYSTGCEKTFPATAISAYTTWEVSEQIEDSAGEVFIDIVHTDGKITVSPREAKAIAKLLNYMAEFVMEGKEL